ncbi:MAG: ABC transporter permease [Planctomycetota bacterium]|nr:ABC transporter permease [Planctomycetota bacterium]
MNMNKSMSMGNSESTPSLWLTCRTLWQREVVRFVRQRGRVVGAMLTPPVFWVLAGAALDQSFILPRGDAGDMKYLEYAFPGALASILLFNAIFSTISIVEDRREGFLQGVLVAPGSRAAIVIGKVLGVTTLATVQAAIFLLIAPIAGMGLSFMSYAATLAAMIVVAFGLTSLGFWIAWRMETTQGFHAIMNLVLMPMLFLSGAFFPATGSAKWLSVVMALNPMTYGVSLIRSSIYMNMEARGGVDGVGVWPALGVSLGFAALMCGLSIRSATRESARVLQ